MNTLAVVFPIFKLQQSQHRIKAFHYVLKQVHNRLRPQQIIIAEQLSASEQSFVNYDTRLTTAHPLVIQDGDFNKSKTINAGVAVARTDLVLVLDTDVALHWDKITELVQTLPEGTVCKPFNAVHRLSERGTVPFVITNKIIKSQILSSVNLLGGGAILLHVSDFKAVGGFDERYVGWGAEDAAFGRSCMGVFKVTELDSPAYHLYHERDEEALVSTLAYKKNRDLYRATRGTSSTVVPPKGTLTKDSKIT